MTNEGIKLFLELSQHFFLGIELEGGYVEEPVDFVGLVTVPDTYCTCR